MLGIFFSNNCVWTSTKLQHEFSPYTRTVWWIEQTQLSSDKGTFEFRSISCILCLKVYDKSRNQPWNAVEGLLKIPNFSISFLLRQWYLMHLQKVDVVLDIQLVLCQQWNNPLLYFSNSAFNSGLLQAHSCRRLMLWNWWECKYFYRTASSAYLLLSCIQTSEQAEFIYVRVLNCAVKTLNILWLIQNIFSSL